MNEEPTAKQMSFKWDLPEDEFSSALSVEEVQLRKVLAEAFVRDPNCWEKDKDGQPVKPYWYDHAIYLHEGNLRFPFRAAVLAAWLATPKKYRVPGTQKELAEMLGLSSDRQFTVWMAKNPQIKAVVHNVWRERSLDRLPDSLEAMYEVAAIPDYKGRGDRELHAKLSGILADEININNKSGYVDISNLSFEEKLKLAKLDTPEALAKFRAEFVKDKEKEEGDAGTDGDA